jgi:outer membrane protein OmpA-like peptidoglycan-associated protein
MKKTLVFCISSLLMITFLSSCGDKQVKSSGGNMVVDGINSQVKGFSIDGFNGGGATMKQNDDFENMKNIVSLVKPLIEKIPDGYVMEITGHCAAYDSPAKQQSVSKARAKKVYDELKNAGAAEAKMTYRGAGIDEPIPSLDPKDFKQRRVSFKAVKK